MITEAEILRSARDWQVDPMLVDLDHVLGCFLSQWFRLPAAKQMLFKGGTCIRKCCLLDAVGAREIELPCYDLREMLLEKLRGFSGQRRFAIARDLYDIQQLLRRMDVRVEDVSPHAREKFAAKGIVLSPNTLNGLHARKDEFETDWARNVVRLTPPRLGADGRIQPPPWPGPPRRRRRPG